MICSGYSVLRRVEYIRIEFQEFFMDQIYSLLNMTLTFMQSCTNDWGIAIIMLTLVIKTLFLPLSWKQKKAMQKQQVVSQKINELKKVYAGNKTRLNEESLKVMQEHGSGFAAFLPILLQMPVFYLLYKLFVSIVSGSKSVMIPWISSLNLPDPYFIMPVLCVIAQLLPNILAATGIIKNQSLSQGGKSMTVVSAVVGFLFMFQAPVALGIYWMFSALYSAAELILFSFFQQKKLLPAS